MAHTASPWRFMGMDRSHFSAKLRPAVRYKEIHCLEIPADGPAILEHTGVQFVPVLISPEGEWLQDTTSIIDELEARHPTPPLIPATAMGKVLCRLFEVYADEFFPMVSMRTRWAYDENLEELKRAFAAFSSSVELGTMLVGRMRAYLPALGVTPDTIPAIDAHLDDLLAALCAHFQAQPFLLGERLSLADCALMGPLYAHLYLDRVTRKKLYEEAIEVCMWIERCNRPVPSSMGGWESTLTPTLREVVSLIATDAMPMMLALEEAFEAWAVQEAKLGAEPPRGTGTYESELRGVPVTAGVRSYVVWKLQRLRAEVTNEALEVLRGTGVEAVLATPPISTPLMKDDNKLIVGSENP